MEAPQDVDARDKPEHDEKRGTERLTLPALQ
jgi:hypothetical protein